MFARLFARVMLLFDVGVLSPSKGFTENKETTSCTKQERTLNLNRNPNSSIMSLFIIVL